MENESKQGYFSKIKKGLMKTSNLFKKGMGNLWTSSNVVYDDESLEELEQVFIESDLGVDVALELVEQIQKKKRFKSIDEAKLFLKEILLTEMNAGNRVLKKVQSPQIVLFSGINGAGKTTSIAKIAQRLKEQNQKVLLAAGDTFRAAAIEQLMIWGERLDLPVVKHKMKSDPAAVVHDACESALSKNIDYVLVDTAGRLHSQTHLMEELKKITRVIQKKCGDVHVEKLIVIDGNAGQNSLSQVKLFNEAIGINGVIITKLDGTAKGGIVVSVEKHLNIPVKFIGVGEGIHDLLPFEPSTFIDALLNDV